MKVAVIIVTYNGIKWIEKCIDSLLDSSHKVNIIVIDNGSTDATLNLLEKYAEIQLIKATKNLGFAKANNEGIKLAMQQIYEFVFLLNQDAWVEKDTIKELIDIAILNPEYGIVSPIHLNGSYTALDLKFANYLIPENCKNIVSDLYLNKLKPLYSTDFVNAAAWLIPVKCLKTVGLFDTSFFFYGEDNNFLQRLQYHGYKVGLATACTICHDREIRQGKLNKINSAKWERSLSLITLLNIKKSFRSCTLHFIGEKIRTAAKSLYNLQLLSFGFQVKEILFFSTHFYQLKEKRKQYQHKNKQDCGTLQYTKLL